MPSPSVLALNYKTVFHNVGRRFVNLDSLPWGLGELGLSAEGLSHMSTSAPESAHQSNFPLDNQHGLSSARLSSAPDVDLDRLERCIRGIDLEIRALPRAAQLPPIPGLRAVDARTASLAVGPGKTFPQIAAAPSAQQQHKVFLRCAMAVITSVAAVVLTGYLVPGDVARLRDEFGSPAMRLFDSLPGALFDLMPPFAPAHSRQNSEAERGTEPAGETVSLRSANVEGPSDGKFEGPAEGATVPQTTTEPVSLTSSPAAPIGEATESKTMDDGAAQRAESPLAEEVLKALNDRGRHFLEAGDVAAARLVFSRAANAGDAAAAVAMGTTYDPVVLGDRGVWGINADPAKARTWYEKAIEFGSAEAQHLLAILDHDIAAARQAADRPRSDETPLNPVMAVRHDAAPTAQGELFPQKQPFQRFKRKRPPSQ